VVHLEITNSPFGLQDMSGIPLAGKGSGCPVSVDSGKGFCLPAEPCLRLAVAGCDEVRQKYRIRAVAAGKRILLPFQDRFERRRQLS
jgi:hypothetical protein